MVPRLTYRSLIAVLVATATLSGCASPMGLQPLISPGGICELGKGRMPILLSRSDTAQTKRKVAEWNDLYEKQCMKERDSDED